MWIKKSDQEIEKDKRKGAIDVPISIFIGVFILNIVDNKLGIRRYSDVRPKSWLEIYSLIPHFFLLSFSIALAVFILQKLFKIDFSKKPIDTYICDKCNKVKRNDNIFECDCGGKYYQIEKMKWVENNIKL